MKGFLISWDIDKGFGFIKGDDNQSYFLHKSEIKKEELSNIKIKSIVEFETKATSKGMRAIKVENLNKEQKEFKKQVIVKNNFIINKDNKPRGIMLFSDRITSGWCGSNDEAKRELKKDALDKGFNCIFYIEHLRGSSGRHYAYNAVGGILVKEVRCKTKKEQDNSKKEMDLFIGKKIKKKEEKEAGYERARIKSEEENKNKKDAEEQISLMGVIKNIFW
jgi:cold shock CspA family protein